MIFITILERKMKNNLHKYILPFVLVSVGSNMFAQDNEVNQNDVEEVVVVGSQIKGASISGALPVSVLSSEDIEALGVDSGDELLAQIAENGANYYNEQDWNGGVNGARGDVGSFNIRNLGTGNTLALINGRRLVQNPSYQTELIGGSYVPVMSVNSNNIPIGGVDRVEILKDGASAIYGADAVAGVVNTVLKKEFEGFNIKARLAAYDHFSTEDNKVSIEFGTDLNDGRTNLGIFFDYYDRGEINANEDPRWADGDWAYKNLDLGPFQGSFRNSSNQGIFGKFYTYGTKKKAWSFYPTGAGKCNQSSAIDLGAAGCLEDSTSSTDRPRTNLNEDRAVRSQLERVNFFVYLNHEMQDGSELFTEIGAYSADSGPRNLYQQSTLGASSTCTSNIQAMIIPAENFYNPLDSDLCKDDYRFPNKPISSTALNTYRLLQGVRGSYDNGWDYEAAFVWSKAYSRNVVENRIGMDLLALALADQTAAAFNPFHGGVVPSNIERTWVDVYRKNETDLLMIDFKLTNNDLFELPGGSAGMLLGYEYREESFADMRDPRLNGTISWTNPWGETYPFVSAVANSSPTPNSSGEREVTSIFAELQMPVMDNLDIQLALRHEDFSDISETATVGKFAFGWQLHEKLLFRGSYQTAFRAPNLVTVFESVVARNNTRSDSLGRYVGDGSDIKDPNDPDTTLFDISRSVQRVARGSADLQPEESTNYSVGFVIDPIENLTIIIDKWEIEKEKSIGLFGEVNHTTLDLLMRLQGGASECVGNPAVERSPADPATAPFFAAAGLCNAGEVIRINDIYTNLDTRIIGGIDLAVLYDFYTNFGDFGIKYQHSRIDEFSQTAGGNAATIVSASEAGLLPGIAVQGFSDLIGVDGNFEDKSVITAFWDYKAYRISYSSTEVGEFEESGIRRSDGTKWIIPSMQTQNITFSYNFDIADNPARLRFAVRNLEDKRAPLADETYGYYSKTHSDYGRNYYLELRVKL